MDKMIFDVNFSKISNIMNFRNFHYKYDGDKRGYGFHNPNPDFVDLDSDTLYLNRATMSTYASLLDNHKYNFAFTFMCPLDCNDIVINIVKEPILIENIKPYEWYIFNCIFVLQERIEWNVHSFTDGSEVDCGVIEFWDTPNVGFITLGKLDGVILYKNIKLFEYK